MTFLGFTSCGFHSIQVLQEFRRKKKRNIQTKQVQGTLSTVLFCLQTMLAVPISPAVENLTPSLVTEIITAHLEPQ